MDDAERSAIEKGRGSYRAFQFEGHVNLVASGYTPTPGYQVWLQLRPPDVFPPQYELLWRAPDGPVPEVLTPFQVSVSFNAPQPVRAVTVFDADGEREIAVERIEGRRGVAAAAQVMANHFAVTAGPTLVTFTASNVAGQPVLTYDRRAFIGDEVRRTQSPLGMLVTATLEEVADGNRIEFTLLVPPVRVQPGATAQVKLVGITTATLSSIAGPPPGQGIKYRVDELAGVANFVVSLGAQSLD